MEARRRPQNNSNSFSVYNAEDGPASIFIAAESNESERKKSKSFGKQAILFIFVLFAAALFFISILYPTNFTEVAHSADKFLLPNRNSNDISHSVEITKPAKIIQNIIPIKETLPVIPIPNPPDVPVPLNSVIEMNNHDNEDNEKAEVIPDVETEAELQSNVDNLLNTIRLQKSHGVVLEEDDGAKALISQVQTYLRKLLKAKYGRAGPFYIEMKLQFPEAMEDFSEKGQDGTIIIELAPTDLVPYSVYYFLQIVDSWKGGAFHRAAGHVLQALVNKFQNGGLAFQEYHPDYPHKRLTMGYAGRPGGPGFYISTVDNVKNHGPGSQGSRTEADSCFGRVFQGEDIVNRMKKQPGKSGSMGFIQGTENYIVIKSLRIMSTDEAGNLTV